MKTTAFTDLLNDSRGLILGVSVTKQGKLKIKTQKVKGGLSTAELKETFKKLTGETNGSK